MAVTTQTGMGGAMIRCEREGAVTALLLDRPEARNAFEWDMVLALGEGIAAAEADAECRCLVIKGAAEHFSAGRDLTAAGAAGDLEAALVRDGGWAHLFHLLHTMRKPSVAVVRGYAVAGGFTLAMGCDFVLAERSARFGALEMRNGFPAAVNAPILAKLVGPRLALEMTLFGDLVGAERLYEMGLVNHLADNAPELAALEADFTARLCALDTASVSLTKEIHRAAVTMPLANALDMGKQLNSLIAASGRLDQAVNAYKKGRTKKKTSRRGRR